MVSLNRGILLHHSNVNPTLGRNIIPIDTGSARAPWVRQDVFYSQAAKVIRAYSRVHMMDFMLLENWHPSYSAHIPSVSVGLPPASASTLSTLH